MKKTLFVFAFLASFVAGTVFADAANALVSFSTKAPSGDYKGDTYADGATVLDGEWYALVWSADGQFEGLNLDCTPTDPNDAVLLLAPLAKGGHCPYVIFQVDSALAKDSGEYAVYLLDTRTADKTAVATKGASGKPSSVNGVQAAQTYTAGSTVSGGSTAKVSTAGVWAATTVDTNMEGYTEPKVTAFKVESENVKITVSGLMPGLKYNVRMGSEVQDLKNYALEVPQTSENPVFTITKGDAKFFQVVREPLSK